MILLIVLCFFALAFAVGCVILNISKTVKGFFFNPENIYISKHKVLDYNDSQYKEYLNWLSENKKTFPIDKIKSFKEHNIDSKINNLFNGK